MLFERVASSKTTASIAVGGFVTLVAIMGIIKVFGKAKEVKEVKAETVVMKVYRSACLFFGAVFQGLFAIGGPLVTVYTLIVVKDKSKFRATMSAIWLLLNGITMISHFSKGMWTIDVLNGFIYMWPLAMIGFKIGTILHDKVNQELFLKIVYVILFFVGGSMFVQNLAAVL